MLYKKWWKRDKCRHDKVIYQDRLLDVHHLGGIFYLLMGGLILAIMVAIIEYYLYSRNMHDKSFIKFKFLCEYF